MQNVVLQNKPWESAGAEAPQSIYTPIGMIGPEERRCYYWLGHNWLSDAGCIVDAGAFLGASTYCFAAGAASAGRRKFRNGKLVHAYDYFKVIDPYVGEAISRDVRPIAEGESYLDIFEQQTSAFSDMIETHPGDFLNQRWQGDPIEILFIDVAKTSELCAHAVAEFFPSLIPGRSVLVHQDYYHCWHPYIHIGMEYLSDEFELADEWVPHQSRVWRLARPIPTEKLQRLAAYDLSKAERCALLERLINKSSARVRPMNEVVRAWQFCLDKDYERASDEITRMRKAYNIDKRSELWATQALEVEREALANIGAKSAGKPRTSKGEVNAHISMDEIIKNYPSFHRKADGTPWFLGISGDTLKSFAAQLQPGMSTVETGAGFSTLAFILKGTDHTAICPDTYLEANIRNWCDDHRIDHSRFKYICAKSQDVVPRLEQEFDFAFIDGEHAFPLPMVDYYYLARRLKVGGLLAVDDTNIWTGDVIAKHLMHDSAWEFVSEHDDKTSVFRLKQKFEDKGLGSQVFVLANSRRLPTEWYETLRR